MKKAIIIANSKFPRGSALANYIQYFMLALMECGYKTWLISSVNEEYTDENGKMQDERFNLKPFSISSLKIIRHYQYRYGFSIQKCNLLKSLGVEENDIVFLFSANKIICKRLLKLRNKTGFRVVVPLLEMYGKEDVNNKSFSRITHIYDEQIPQFDMVFPISTFIENYYKKKGCRTFCLPIMADCQEYPLQDKNFEKYKFILPANGRMKDDLYSMLKGFVLLSSEQISKIEIHICGVKEEIIRSSLSAEELKKIESALTIHKWMKYDELVALYQKMHYLILARQESQMTLANFPSKIPETMGFGIVPICSAVGDYTKYYLRDGVDSIHMKGSSPAICHDAISKAVDLPVIEYLSLSRNARKTAETRFDYRVWTPKIKAALDNL